MLKVRVMKKKLLSKLTSDVICIAVIGIIIVLNVIVFTLTSAFGLFLYDSEVVDLTISGATDALFADAIEDGKKVTVMFCQAEDEVAASQTGAYVLDTAKQFEEKYPGFIQLEYVNLITKRNTKNELVDLSKYQTVDEESGYTSPIFKSAVIFECGKNSKVVMDASESGYANFFTLDSSSVSIAYNGEEMFASMVSWVLHDEHKTAYSTIYHGEVVDVGLVNMFVSAGYNFDTIDLRKNEIPEDAGVLIISNPVKDFERAMEGSSVRSEIERLRTYIEGGGMIYVAIDPYVEKLDVLEEFLAEYGIEIYETEKNGKTFRNIVRDSMNAITADNFTLVTEFADTEMGGKISSTVSSYVDSSVIVRESAALKLNEKLGAEPLLVSSSASATYAGSDQVNDDGGYCVGAVSTVVGDGGETGRVFVTSGIYLTATDALVSGGYANRTFIYAMIEHAFGAENIPYGCRTVYYDTQTLENLTMGTARLYTVMIIAVPVIIAVVGAVVVIRRKNR